jgi:hypothetical protein
MNKLTGIICAWILCGLMVGCAARQAILDENAHASQVGSNHNYTK